MILPLLSFNHYLNWNEAKITYLSLEGNSLHMDVSFLSFKQENHVKFSRKNPYMKLRIIFREVKVLTDNYFSPLEKILSRFKGPYECYATSIENNHFVIDDCLKIACNEVEFKELPY